MYSTAQHTVRCRHVAPVLVDTDEAERKERLRQLLGSDFKDDAPAPVQPAPPAQRVEPLEDKLAGRRVRQQQRSSAVAVAGDAGAGDEAHARHCIESIGLVADVEGLDVDW